MSTSSNESEYDAMQYRGAWANEIKSPWYPTLGQPFIYFSQAQPFNRKLRVKGTEKENPNCFKKAFRWYTQERVPFKDGRADFPSDIQTDDAEEFAAWLDEKYNEFLLNKQIKKNKYFLTQTSVIKMENNADYEQFKQMMSKKYKRFKRSNQSIEIILKAKDLSRPASECCQGTKAQSCCNRSSSAVGSNASTNDVMKPRSQSLTSVKEREIYNKMNSQDAPNYGAKREKLKQDQSSNHKLANRNFKLKKNHPTPVLCHCSKYISKKSDAYSQVEDKAMKVSDPWQLKDIEMKSPLDTKNTIKHELVTASTNTSVIKPNTKPEYVIQIEETTIEGPSTSTEKNKTAFIAPASEGVQTSNYALNLNQGAFPANPLFIKIICADKFIEA